MQPDIFTYKDALRRAAKRAALAVGAAVILNLALLGVVFGTDPASTIRLGQFAAYCVLSGAVIAAVLAGGMAFGSSLMMRELSLARVELLNLSHTDQLTGLLNRRGYDKAALEALQGQARPASRRSPSCATSIASRPSTTGSGTISATRC